MLFGKTERIIHRIVIVEDEPLVAFDNEHFLRDAGYEVAATVDTVPEAIAAIMEGVDLVLADVNLSSGGSGRDVARIAKERGVPLVYVTGSCPDDARNSAMGLLAKPYSQRDLLGAIQAVDARLAGRQPRRVPKGFTLFAE
ncbi:response regulator [uncultured Sphingomonas sp.]|uniref:response regulator n=1 Tax=uncultured Sphingomonas sp. TaxID=158754 RepID=UPI0025D8A814|nr:response regulator [uncultured Sphingomonas sp.]